MIIQPKARAGQIKLVDELVKEAVNRQTGPVAYVELTDEERLVLVAQPQEKRAAILAQMRPNMNSSMRRQLLKRQGLR